MNRLLPVWFWIFSAIIFFPVLNINLIAQGASDGGVSSMPVFKPVKEIFAPGQKNRMSFGMSAGVGDYSIFVLTPQVGYSRMLGKHFSADGRVTAAWHSGNGVSLFGLGDVFVNMNYLPFRDFSFSGGIKLRLNLADKFYSDEIVYPMDYQSSLGTIDFYTGIAYHPGNWHFALMWQQPFVQNENWFYPDSLDYPDSPFNEFPGTYGFIRKGDLIYRIARTITIGDQVSFTPGILSVYHLAEDEIPDDFDGYENVKGSKGLTLNITLMTTIKLNEKSNLEINMGLPVITRDVQLEGLMRKFVMGAEYAVAF